MLVCTRSGRHASANLTPASRRQDHTTSPPAASICRQRALRSLTGKPALPSRRAPNAAASTASRPASVTIAIRPSEGWDGGAYRFDLGDAGMEMFLEAGLDCPHQIDPVQQIKLDTQGGLAQRVPPRVAIRDGDL